MGGGEQTGGCMTCVLGTLPSMTARSSAEDERTAINNSKTTSNAHPPREGLCATRTCAAG
eukprot:14351859-Alexandrium_andersonii.AAC.2